MFCGGITIGLVPLAEAVKSPETVNVDELVLGQFLSIT